MSWIKNKVFNNGSVFVKWLDKNFGKYIEDHISELHVHHTWKPNHSNKQPLLQLHENMRNYHVGTRGWSDIGQHLSIGKNGDVALGRDIKIMPASAFGYNGATNWHPFMFEMIGDFDKGQDKLDGDQLDTVMAISQYFNKKNKKIRFHREMDNKKSCPGTGISKEWFMSQVTGKKVTQKESEPKTEVKSSTTKKSEKQSGDPYIRTVQQWVVDKGFKIGVDGLPGPETRKGLYMVLQSELNEQFGARLVVDGIPGSKTKAALVTVRKGASGDITRVIQALLYIGGYYKGGFDGDYGKLTKGAVVNLQKAKRLKPYDGVVGPITWGGMFSI